MDLRRSIQRFTFVGRIVSGVFAREATVHVFDRRSIISRWLALLASALFVFTFVVSTPWSRASDQPLVAVTLMRAPTSFTAAAIASDGTHLWVADTSRSASRSNALFEVVGNGLRPVASSLLTAPRLLAATPDAVYTVGASDAVTVTSLASDVTTSLSDPSINSPVALAAQGGFLWVLNALGPPHSHGSITGFNLATGQVTLIENRDFNTPVQLAATSSALWVLNTDGSLDRVDLVTNRVTQLNVGVGTIRNMASDATGLYLLVDSGATSSLLSVDPSSETVTTFTNPSLVDVTSLTVTPTTVWMSTSTGGSLSDGSLVSFDRDENSFALVSDPAIFNPVEVAVVGATPWFIGRDSAGTMVFGAVISSLASAFTRGLLPPRVPPASLTPWPNPMNGACQFNTLRSSFVVTTACTNEQVQSIDVAHELEHVRPMILPTNWNSLTPGEQLFVLADLERVDRHLPPYLGLNRALSREAAQAVRRNVDPSLASGFALHANTSTGLVAFASTWAQNFSTLSADYFWMYNDGWAGASTGNIGCTSANAAPCWGHRQELLGLAPKEGAAVGLHCRTCEMGTAAYVYQSSAHWYNSYVDLVERPAGAPPPMYFTWARDVVPYLP